MKTKALLFFTLLLSATLMAQQENMVQVSPKKANNTYGFCLMGKTMQCDGVTMSYIATEQAKMSFTIGLEYNREYMLGATPLGVVTGIRLEYCRPYANVENDGQVYELKAHDLTGVIPVMLQYHDKLGDLTELLLFTGPSLDMVVFRKGNVGSLGGGSYFFGGMFGSGFRPAWNWIGVSWNYGIGIRYNDITFKLSSALGLLNHFDKDYTAQYLGYPIRINRPVIGTVMFQL